MVKRMFDNEEMTVTKKNVKNQEKELIKLKKARDIRSIIRDVITPYNREIEDENVKNIIDQLEEKIKQTEYSITETNKQIKFGVEQKHGN
ncbi:MAG: hypothetical protein AABY22_23855 [Nanoarchaeota archaeon]